MRWFTGEPSGESYGSWSRSIPKELEISADWSRDLVEHSRDLLCIHDLEGHLLSVNPVPAQVLGYSVEEILKIPMRELVDPKFRDQFDSYLREIACAGEASGVLAVLTRTGKQRLWEYHCTLRTEGVEKPVVRGIAHDVTDRVAAERALRNTNKILEQKKDEQETLLRGLQLFHTLLDQSNDAIEVVDPQSMRLLDVNQKACSELGYTRDELLTMTVYDIDANLTKAMVEQNLVRLRETGSLTIEGMHWRKDGTTFPVEVNIGLVRADRDYVIAVARNITERKLAEQELHKRDEQIRLFIGYAPAGLAMFDREMRYIYASRRWKADYGLGDRDVRGLCQYDLFPEIPERWKQCHRRGLAGEALGEENDRFERADGSVQWVRWGIQPWHETSGAVGGILIFAEEITQRMLAEDALRESEEQIRLFIDHAPASLAMFDREMRYLQVSRRWRTDLGLGDRDLRGLSFYDVLPEAPDQWKEAHRRALTGEVLRHEHDHFERTGGSVEWVRWEMRPWYERTGEIGGIVIFAEDLTERERAEEALRQSEERLRLAQEAARMGSFERDLQTGAARWVPLTEAMYGLQPGTGPTGFDDFLQLIHPDDRSKVAQWRDESVQTGVKEGEWRAVWPDGSLHWIAARWRISKDEQGRPTRVLGMNYDITERKRVEEALRASEAELQEAQRVAHLGNWRIDLKTQAVSGSKEMHRIFGADLKSAPRTFNELARFFPPESWRQIQQANAKAPQTEQPEPMEVEFLRPDGSTGWLLVRSKPDTDSSGNIVGLHGIALDVSERKRIEEELRQAKERLTEEKLYLEQEIDTELGFEEIIGQSKALKAVMESASKVAASNATVLLLGETGTGKELVARAIHRLSGRAGKAFIKMNCAAIPYGLLESELFGAEKGAFTGSVSKKIGRLELADKGTIFLDEIGEISLSLQPKLLRVLQDQEFERLGGTQTLKVDFRLIAATNRDLAQSVRENEFRQDLFYRLNVFPIRVPPLRERRDDIPLLVEHFVQKCARRMNKVITSIPKRTMDALAGWDWPGNVRELENFIERSVILTRGTVLSAPLSELQPTFAEKKDDETLKAAERRHILRALRDSHGQISGPRGAAARLGLKRTTLQSKLKQMGINPRTPPM